MLKLNLVKNNISFKSAINYDHSDNYWKKNNKHSYKDTFVSSRKKFIQEGIELLDKHKNPVKYATEVMKLTYNSPEQVEILYRINSILNDKKEFTYSKKYIEQQKELFKRIFIKSPRIKELPYVFEEYNKEDKIKLAKIYLSKVDNEVESLNFDNHSVLLRLSNCYDGKVKKQIYKTNVNLSNKFMGKTIKGIENKDDDRLIGYLEFPASIVAQNMVLAKGADNSDYIYSEFSKIISYNNESFSERLQAAKNIYEYADKNYSQYTAKWLLGEIEKHENFNNP